MVLILSILGCKKEDIEPTVEEEPKFYIKGVLDGEPFLWEAGVNNIYGGTYSNVVKNIRLFNFNFAKRDTVNIDTPLIEVTITSAVSPPPSKPFDDAQKSIFTGDYPYAKRPASPDDPIPNSHIVVTMYKNINQIYYSTFAVQNGSEFNISKIEDVVNEGINYKIVEGTFSCDLKHFITNDTIHLKEGAFKVAFGID